MAEMHPLMRINQKIGNDGKPEYELLLSRANFNHLTAGCPDFDCIYGRSDNGTSFHLFNGLDGISSSFKIMGTGDGYFANIGVRAPLLSPDVSPEELDRLSQQFSANLEKAINDSGRIPIEIDVLSKPINIGYAILKVEKR